jgi:hypothetical protein
MGESGSENQAGTSARRLAELLFMKIADFRLWNFSVFGSLKVMECEPEKRRGGETENRRVVQIILIK